ncbi:MAG: hypothetical protein WC828_09325 [Thermoleophilia bacterium]|jgi:hypothetical protein
MDRRYLLKTVLIFLVASFAMTLGFWLGIPFVQAERANTKLASANNHIEEANMLMSRIEADKLGADTFSSLENINVAREAVAGAEPLLKQAMDSVRSASIDARSAASLSTISPDYRDYLLKKAEIADLRGQQLQVLADTVAQLGNLYEAGTVVFTSLDEMDKLLGQFQVAMSMVQSNPAQASTTLKQTSQAMLQVKQQLDDGYAATGFNLLSAMSRSVNDYADLSSLAAQLADAAGAGDQTQAQAAAIELERKLMSTGSARTELENWWQSEIKPRETLYRDLQAQMETLDEEAAGLYATR